MAPPDKGEKSRTDGDSLDDLKGELDTLLGDAPAADDESLDDLDSLLSDLDDIPEETSYEAAPDTGALDLPEEDEPPADDDPLFGAGADEGPFDIEPEEEEEEEEDEEEEAGFTTTFESSGPTFGERMQAGLDRIATFIGDITFWGWGAIFAVTILMVALALGIYSLLGAGDDYDAYQNNLFWAMILMLVGLIMAVYLSLYEVIHEWFEAFFSSFSRPKPEATGDFPDDDEAGEDDENDLY